MPGSHAAHRGSAGELEPQLSGGQPHGLEHCRHLPGLRVGQVAWGWVGGSVRVAVREDRFMRGVRGVWCVWWSMEFMGGKKDLV